ncbi:MAG: hypothetical protein ACP5MD_15205, partial [Verrucomicrobiia bacterium]
HGFRSHKSCARPLTGRMRRRIAASRSALEKATAPGARPSRPHQPDDRSYTGFDHTNPAPDH